MYIFYFFILFLVLIFFGAFFDAPWIPTNKKNFDRIAQLAKLQHDMLFYDLGSGSGKMLFYLSEKYHVNCVGIEISPFLYLYSKIKSLFSKRVKIYYGNFYKYDLSKADVVYIFLLPKAYLRLEEKLKRELKKGTKIILSYSPLKNCEPIEISKKYNAITYYLYIL